MTNQFTFAQTNTDEDFKALNACQTTLNIAGFSVGPWQANAPCGALYGGVIISKWRGMSAPERAELHASFEGDGRNGPIVLTIHNICPEGGRAALEIAARERTEKVDA